MGAGVDLSADAALRGEVSDGADEVVEVGVMVLRTELVLRAAGVEVEDICRGRVFRRARVSAVVAAAMAWTKMRTKVWRIPHAGGGYGSCWSESEESEESEMRAKT